MPARITKDIFTIRQQLPVLIKSVGRQVVGVAVLCLSDLRRAYSQGPRSLSASSWARLAAGSALLFSATIAIYAAIRHFFRPLPGNPPPPAPPAGPPQPLQPAVAVAAPPAAPPEPPQPAVVQQESPSADESSSDDEASDLEIDPDEGDKKHCLFESVVLVSEADAQDSTSILPPYRQKHADVICAIQRLLVPHRQSIDAFISAAQSQEHPLRAALTALNSGDIRDPELRFTTILQSIRKPIVSQQRNVMLLVRTIALGIFKNAAFPQIAGVINQMVSLGAQSAHRPLPCFQRLTLANFSKTVKKANSLLKHVPQACKRSRVELLSSNVRACLPAAIPFADIDPLLKGNTPFISLKMRLIGMDSEPFCVTYLRHGTPVYTEAGANHISPEFLMLIEAMQASKQAGLYISHQKMNRASYNLEINAETARNQVIFDLSAKFPCFHVIRIPFDGNIVNHDWYGKHDRSSLQDYFLQMFEFPPDSVRNGSQYVVDEPVTYSENLKGLLTVDDLKQCFQSALQIFRADNRTHKQSAFFLAISLIVNLLLRKIKPLYAWRICKDAVDRANAGTQTDLFACNVALQRASHSVALAQQAYSMLAPTIVKNNPVITKGRLDIPLTMIDAFCELDKQAEEAAAKRLSALMGIVDVSIPQAVYPLHRLIVHHNQPVPSMQTAILHHSLPFIELRSREKLSEQTLNMPAAQFDWLDAVEPRHSSDETGIKHLSQFKIDPARLNHVCTKFRLICEDSLRDNPGNFKIQFSTRPQIIYDPQKSHCVVQQSFFIGRDAEPFIAEWVLKAEGYEWTSAISLSSRKLLQVEEAVEFVQPRWLQAANEPAAKQQMTPLTLTVIENGPGFTERILNLNAASSSLNLPHLFIVDRARMAIRFNGKTDFAFPSGFQLVGCMNQNAFHGPLDLLTQMVTKEETIGDLSTRMNKFEWCVVQREDIPIIQAWKGPDFSTLQLMKEFQMLDRELNPFARITCEVTTVRSQTKKEFTRYHIEFSPL